MRPTSYSKGIIRALFFVGTICLGWTINAESQSHTPTSTAEKKDEFKIRVGVEEVRLDSVVLDQKGHQITDLTADDFELYQDGLRQKITSCIYINDYRPQPQPKIPNHAARDTKSMPPLPTPAPAREEVHRTIAFVVDNLVMSYDQVQLSRRALQKFVETQMQPGDLVAIMPTASGNASLGMFSSDKRHLLAIIGALRWFIDLRTTNAASQFSVASYYIQALRDMPGRKHLIMITPKTMLPAPAASPFPTPILSMLAAFNPVADAALRAGVVIHTLDVAGLEGPEYVDPDFGADHGSFISKYLDENGEFNPLKRGDAIALNAYGKNSETPIPLSEKTGGLFLRHVNWLANGIGEANEEMKGYYIITYAPPSNTFSSDSRNVCHSIKIQAKRPGSVVHTRDGFFGTARTPEAAIKHSNPLLEAMLSPYQHSDLAVHLFSGFINDPKKGYLIQARLHLNGGQLSIFEEKGKGSLISLDTSAVTTDIFGAVRDSGNNSYKIPIKNKEQIPWIRKHGLSFFIEIPAKKPGSYYVRVAVQDKGSGKLGSAYQYVEIPDLKNGHLALSNIFVTNHDKAADTNLQPSEGRTGIRAALGIYSPGECIQYAAVIYNAKFSQERPADLESNVVLYREGAEIFRSKAEKVALSDVHDFKRIPLKGELFLDAATKPGDYVLRLQIWDKQVNGNQNRASQTLSFEVP
jgi:VWFA-related protein